MQVQLLLSPLAAGAYFASASEIAAAELRLLTPDAEITVEAVGPMSFLCADLPEALLPAVARLSAAESAAPQIIPPRSPCPIILRQ